MKGIINSEFDTPLVELNMAQFIKAYSYKYKNNYVVKEKKGDNFIGLTWQELFSNILKIISNLHKFSYQSGDKVMIISGNSIEMLETELAVQCSGGIIVPIDSRASIDLIEDLIVHSDSKFLFIENNEILEKLNLPPALKAIFTYNDAAVTSYPEVICFNMLLAPITKDENILELNTDPDDICLNMYTSGTMGMPKCVQLSHRNILSQQYALKLLWDIDHNDRILNYLPWHHSFGGIFEKFAGLFNSATIYLNSEGKFDIDTLWRNWELVKPTLFFSVPRVYDKVFSIVNNNQKSEDIFFHPELKFVFTASAPLQKRYFDIFKSRKIPVLEGYGLTETSPCCTLSINTTDRITGNVGYPLPGVSIRISQEDEIQIQGLNVMKGYYKNDKANAKAFTEDGWFKSDDIGQITENGIKLVGRKNRVCKLLNGEKASLAGIEQGIASKCDYIANVYADGDGRNYPIALIFPSVDDKNDQGGFNPTIKNCECPLNIQELSECLGKCLVEYNNTQKENSTKIGRAMLIDEELSISNNTLTASLKMKPKQVKKVYSEHISKLYGNGNELPNNTYVYNLKK